MRNFSLYSRAPPIAFEPDMHGRRANLQACARRCIVMAATASSPGRILRSEETTVSIPAFVNFLSATKLAGFNVYQSLINYKSAAVHAEAGAD